MSDDAWMARALDLAARGEGWTLPNPLVGAVIVRNGELVAEGYHARVGGPHAEIVALQRAGEIARGATVYVNLEPCNHQGRTGPCTRALIAAGVARVVYALEDPNPLTAGQARAALAQAGIDVTTGVGATEALRLNEAFFKFIRTRRPFVTLKMAMTLDGKIATAQGESRYISGEASRAFVQRLRAQHAAVMVGIGTVRMDDPRLDARQEGAHQPVRVILDPLAATPLASRLFASSAPTLVAVGPAAPADARDALVQRGAAVLELPLREGYLDLESLMIQLAARELGSVLIEGGGGLNASALRQGIVDKVIWFVAPRLLGGRHSPTPMEGPDPAHLSEGISLRGLRCYPSGEDLRLEAYL